MTLSVPLPSPHAERQLGPLHLGTLAYIRRSKAIQRGGADLLEEVTGLSEERADDVIEILKIRSLVMHHRHEDGTFSIACPLFVRKYFRIEKDRNKKRKHRGSHLEWPFYEMVQKHFPDACPHPVRKVFRTFRKRPQSYLLPSVFEPLLKKFPNSHEKDRPELGEVIAGPYLPAEYAMLIRMLEEKMQMGFRLHLLYTRKSVSVVRLH